MNAQGNDSVSTSCDYYHNKIVLVKQTGSIFSELGVNLTRPNAAATSLEEYKEQTNLLNYLSLCNSGKFRRSRDASLKG